LAAIVAAAAAAAGAAALPLRPSIVPPALT